MMQKRKIVRLEYIPEFCAYGIKKKVIAQLNESGIMAKILLPQELQKVGRKDAATVGFLLGQKQSATGDEYYYLAQSYLRALSATGVQVIFCDYDNAYRQMKDCDAAILPGGSFNNPESFYIDGKILGDVVDKRYFAYRAVIAQAYHDRKPMLGICGGAQMIGALLGNMKMYRNLKKEVLHPALHNSENSDEVCTHQIKLQKGTPIFEIMGIKSSEERVVINSRHNQAMVHDFLQKRIKTAPRVNMDIYAVCESDGIPEIWGNEEAGILCVQGHPEDLISNPGMQNLYNYIARKAQEYKMKRIS